MKQKIRKLVDFAINSKSPTNMKLILNIIDEKEASYLNYKTGLSLNGYKRCIDKFGINHTLKNHGDVFYYAEEVRTGRKELCFATMYKRKPTTFQ